MVKQIFQVNKSMFSGIDYTLNHILGLVLCLSALRPSGFLILSEFGLIALSSLTKPSDSMAFIIIAFPEPLDYLRQFTCSIFSFSFHSNLPSVIDVAFAL